MPLPICYPGSGHDVTGDTARRGRRAPRREPAPSTGGDAGHLSGTYMTSEVRTWGRHSNTFDIMRLWSRWKGVRAPRPPATPVMERLARYMAATAEYPPPQGGPLMRSECCVFSTSLLGDSVHVVLGVLGRRPCGSSVRQMAEVGVAGACAPISVHPSNDTPGVLRRHRSYG